MDQQAPNALLLKALAPTRFAAFSLGAADDEAALDLYVWDRDLAAAFFADIAVIEVATRHAIHRQLVADFGLSWDTTASEWDDRTLDKLRQARSRLGSRLTPDRLVAELMFGFWLGLLDAGGRATTSTGVRRVKYESLWRSTLHRAFPGATAEARMQGLKASRTWVHARIATVGALRNRVAHHEPLINGIPLPGQFDSLGRGVRVTAAEAHATCLLVAGMVDRDLKTWVAATSSVPKILASRP